MSIGLRGFIIKHLVGFFIRF